MWFASDVVRALVAEVIGLVFAVVVRATLEPPLNRIERIYSFVFVMAIGFTAGHAVLTWWSLHGRTGTDLKRALRVGVDERSTAWSRLLGAEGPAWSIATGLLVLVSVAVLTLVPGVRANSWVMVTAILLATAGWLDVLVTYAAFYARADHTAEPRFRFPDDHERRFDDYLYVAVNAQTTFGATDVEVVHPDMRRHLMVHGLMSFVYNTVIIAVLVSLMLA